MRSAGASIAVMITLALTAACAGSRVVDEPLYSVVAREDSPGARACVDRAPGSEQQAADCLARCAGATRVDQTACADAGRAGHLCATVWREHGNDVQATTAGLGRIAAGAMVVALVVALASAIAGLGSAHP